VNGSEKEKYQARSRVKCSKLTSVADRAVGAMVGIDDSVGKTRVAISYSGGTSSADSSRFNVRESIVEEEGEDEEEEEEEEDPKLRKGEGKGSDRVGVF
jgi:hypothetical protein